MSDAEREPPMKGHTGFFYFALLEVSAWARANNRARVPTQHQLESEPFNYTPKFARLFLEWLADDGPYERLGDETLTE